ncbi:nickel-type superoxide dismutase maturation protease [Rubidibacter lacunae KORDI 51-2]|uniref:Nickel-type superoxide dismutase maturation protease n=1 Tax=Rubidibacter lacunae KORDI 51-2 TaxID=582515 RepID=U5DBU9_9CHRO|nr:nickel-type superoxide dismutase maturation protease [Rubidibacter lacunae]ERN42003.1 nickel-type superoxide dismutase maturation protease [Rubidibacter lacunae KORDI 51-2]
MTAFLSSASPVDLILWLCRRRQRFQVSGESMLPLLRAGDEVLAVPSLYWRAPLRPGDLVVLNHPYRPTLLVIKRIEQVTREGNYRVCGDNPAASNDSRQFGAVLPETIVGKVVCRL